MTGASSRSEYCLPSPTTTCIFWLIQPLNRYLFLYLCCRKHHHRFLLSSQCNIIVILGISILADIKVMAVLPFSSSPQAAIVDPVDPDSVVAAVKEEGVRAFNILILPGVNICPKLWEIFTPGLLQLPILDSQVTLTTLLTTHHHWDHAGGNADLIKKVIVTDLPAVLSSDCNLNSLLIILYICCC